MRRRFDIHSGTRPPMPRGIATSGPAVLSYGFRPFFLLAALYAISAMLLWIGALSGLWPVGGSEGPIGWHAHEMLFGYASAALAGFVLTAVPNWTGRLPLSGSSLLALVGIWLVGRAVSISPHTLGEPLSALLDALFLPALAFAIAREVIAGRNWQNLRVAVGITTLGALNVAFHIAALWGGDVGLAIRATIAVYVLLIGQVGGRIIPSFTRNYLARRGIVRLPAPPGKLDQLALLGALIAGLAWTVASDAPATAIVSIAAACLHGARLARWRGYATWREPLLLVLHLAYAFVPIGFLAIALSSLGILAPPSAVHLLTVGAIGITTFAVMTRASRGHTGRALAASIPTTCAYACLIAVALSRPIAELAPDVYHPILVLSAFGWIAAFAAFVVEYAPMLVMPSDSGRPKRASSA